MKIVAMLNFWDEREDWIHGLIQSLDPLKPDALVAVDGRYEHYHGAREHGGRDIHTLITSCAVQEITLDLYAEHTWRGNEVEKRRFMLGRALEITSPEDWLLVVDADYRLHDCPLARYDLRHTNLLAAEVAFYESKLSNGAPGTYPARLFMRATPGLEIQTNHYHYHLPNGDRHHILGDRDSTLPALDLCSVSPHRVLVEHRVHHREPERRAAQTAFYERRDAYGVEQ